VIYAPNLRKSTVSLNVGEGIITALSHNWRLSKNSLARACGRVRRRKPGEVAA